MAWYSYCCPFFGNNKRSGHPSNNQAPNEKMPINGGATQRNPEVKAAYCPPMTGIFADPYRYDTPDNSPQHSPPKFSSSEPIPVAQDVSVRQPPQATSADREQDIFRFDP